MNRKVILGVAALVVLAIGGWMMVSGGGDDAVAPRPRADRDTATADAPDDPADRPAERGRVAAADDADDVLTAPETDGDDDVEIEIEGTDKKPRNKPRARTRPRPRAATVEDEPDIRPEDGAKRTPPSAFDGDM